MDKIAPPPVRTRRPTEAVDDALEKILQGGNYDELLASLTETQREMLDQLVQEMHAGNMGDVADLWNVDYIRQPPTIEEFITDDYWLGQILKPDETGNGGLFDGWKEILIKDFDIESKIHNIVITGSLGSGKSFVSAIIILYRIVLTRLLRKPALFLGLSHKSTVYYSVLSITKAQVRETVFGDMVTFMSNCPFFIEECSFNPDLKHSDNKVDLGNNIAINVGSKGWHAIGKNMMGCLLDEGNFRLEANPNVKAYQLFNELRARIRNRFQVKGFLPAITILSSSAADESSVTEKIIAEIEQAAEPDKQKVYRKAIYHIKRKSFSLDSRWFKVSYGLKNVDPYILRGWYREDGTVIPVPDETPEEPPPGSQTELVPESLMEPFRRNVRQGLQMMSGISSGGSHKLFPSVTDLEQCIEMGEEDGLVNPCRLKLVPLSMENDKQLWEYLEHGVFLTRRLGQVLPIRHPDAPRFGHVDLATQSMAGVSICHLVGQKKIEDYKDGRIFSEYRLVVEYDFILTIVAGQTKPISLEKIQNFFFWLRDYCSYSFGLVTYDQWNSELSLQMLESRGFEVKKQSLDRTKDAYYAWRSAAQERRLRMFRQDQLMAEVEELLDLPQKIEHPSDGSKDTSDSSAGSYFSAINSKNKFMGTADMSMPALIQGSSIERIIHPPPITIPIPPGDNRRPGGIFDA